MLNSISFSTSIEGKLRCSKCGQYKSTDLFYIHKVHKRGFDAFCKDCRKQDSLARHRTEARGDFTLELPDKECRSCGKVKAATEFKARNYAKKKFDWLCRACRSVRTTQTRDQFKNRCSSSMWRKRLCEEEPEKLLWFRAKTRANKYHIEFNIEPSDIVIPKICPILGIPISLNIFSDSEKVTYNNPGTPSLDRVDSTKGYIKGNVAVISYRANTIKNCGTAEEHQKIAEFIRDHVK